MTAAPSDEARQLLRGLGASEAKMREWREVPPVFVRDVFGVIPDKWQDKALEAFPLNNRIAGAACKNPGKTALEAWFGWNFMLTRPHCKVPCTSITSANLRDCLWAEFAKWQNKSDLLKATFQWTQKRIFAKQHEQTWWASARAWDESPNPEEQAKSLAGLHEDYLLFLVDEVGDIPDAVVATAEAALGSGIETKLVIMGNCTQTSGPLWRACGVDRRFWFLVRITGDPDDPDRSPRIDIKEARRMIEKYGRDSYFVKVNILGEFPDRAADKLIDMRDCELAMEVAIGESVYNGEARVAGVDVARFGVDNSTFAPRQGRAAFRVKEWHGLDTVQLADNVIRSGLKWKAERIFIDVTGGYGAGVFDQAKSRGFGRMVSAVNFSGRAEDEAQFGNKRAEMYWRAAEWVKGGGALPNDPGLAEELSAPRYFYGKGLGRGNRMFIEDKDDIKARLGRSPDKADAFVLTFASPVMSKRSRDLNELRGARRRRSNDYDPLSERRN